MKMKRGKIFQNIASGQIVDVEYNLTDAYFEFIQLQQSLGNRQVIITSSIMIQVAELLLTKYSAELASIEFMIDSDELDEEIAYLIECQKNNKAYWSVLKEKLQFLQKEDSVEIKRISFSSKEYCSTLDIYVNGIFQSSDTAYGIFSNALLECIAGCV